MAEIIVETTSGRIQGARDEHGAAFLGVPYAAPPTGALRFLPPRPHPGWAGVRDATRFGDRAVQGAAPGSERDFLPEHRGAISEDCLVLNVWTPATEGSRPVLVWIHGGGFMSGSGAWPITDGDRLAEREDVVVVTLNHRLGLLGFLHLGGVLGEDYAMSGNVGMLDVVAALAWVHDNVAAFGGDPERVTIFGQSGGAGKVSALLAMPDALSLFHRAVLQSGTGRGQGSGPGMPIEEADDIANRVLAHLGLTPATAGKLLELPADQLLDAQREMLKSWTPGSAGGRNFRPVVEGRSLPAHPWTAMAEGASAHIPIMIGSTLEETLIFTWAMEPEFRANPTGFSISEDDLRRRLSSHLGDATDATIAHYRRTHEGASNFQIYTAISSDFLRIGVIEHAQRKLAGGGEPPYTYLFTWRSPVHGGALGASHTFEIPYVFSTTDRALATEAGPAALVEAMSGAWAEFARSGSPNRSGLAPWSPYSTGERPTMIFNEESGVELDPLKVDREYWAGLEE